MMAVDAAATRRQLGDNPLIEGLERLPVPATTLTIFGATGDLARRKLLPALYNLAHEGALPERFNLIGVSRREQSDDEFRELRARGDHGVLAPRAGRRRCSTGLLEPACATSASRSTTRDGYETLGDGDRRARRGGAASRSTAPTTSRPRRSSSR